MAQEPMAGDRVVNNASSILWRRLPYMLSPQMDIYQALRDVAEEQSVLEIGFGTGMGVLQYADVATDVDALEPDSAAYDFALQYIPIPNVDWYNESIENFQPTPGFEYTRIFMIEVLEHVEDADVALDRVRKLLYFGGKAVISAPNMFRLRKKKEPLNNQEWAPEKFTAQLKEHFGNVRLVNHTLKTLSEQVNTLATPLIAICS